MSRPSSIWLAFFACALLVAGALALVSRHALALETERRAAAAAMELSQNARLALWRMDSEAAALLVRENNRPPAAFRGPERPDDAPPAAKAYFEIDAEGKLAAVVPAAAETRTALRDMLGIEDTAVAAAAGEPAALSQFNVDLAYAAANAVVPEWEPVAEEAQPAPPKAAPRPARRQLPSKEDAADAKRAAEVADVQKRGRAVQQMTNRAVSAVEPVPAAQADLSESAADQVAAAAPSAPSAPPPVESGVTALQPLWLDGELLLVRAAGPAGQRRVQGLWLDHRTLAAGLLSEIRDLFAAAQLRPYEPFVFHRGEGAAGWVHKRIEAIPRAPDNPTLSLLSLPWELVPGPAGSVFGTASPLRLPLGLAWGGLLLALAAAAFLLRGVLALSERRAAFVSSVTHELRTPLTTFSLYSEMLAEGMVKDPAKRQEYLRTLHRESGRLGHLVENVLAYSRLERGTARGRSETLNLAELIARVLPRLQERAASAGGDVSVDLPDQVEMVTVTTDPGAIEQILFNLADNSAKYAPFRPDLDAWSLVVQVEPAAILIDFRDTGPGIGPKDRRRLFRPFHKSAQEAANTRPGVGLGLALSRRLARALGGDLRLHATGPDGTTFRLRLPRRQRDHLKHPGK